MFNLFFVLMVYSFVKYFSKKLILLLILEMFMIFAIFNFLRESTFGLCFFLLSVFMVLDGVFGMCCFIYSSRDSSLNSFYVSNF